MSNTTRTITHTICPYCVQLVPENAVHDCRQFQISALKAQVRALSEQVEDLAGCLGIQLPCA